MARHCLPHGLRIADPGEIKTVDFLSWKTKGQKSWEHVGTMYLLVGALEHVFFFFPYIGEESSKVTFIFFRGVENHQAGNVCEV